jgi:hypothetical protein
LKGTSLSADQIADALLKGAAGKKAPHGKPMAGLTVSGIGSRHVREEPHVVIEGRRR